MTNIGTIADQAKSRKIEFAKAGGVATKKESDALSFNSLGGGIGFMSSTKVKDNNRQGEIVSTGVNTDLAIQGQGYFVVQHAGNKGVFATRAGSFRLNNPDGLYINSGGYALMGWEYDKEGRLPANNALLTSLTPVDLAATKGAPKATTSIALSMNLSASQSALRGPGVKMSMQRTGLNASTARKLHSDIIFPEQLTGSKLTFGDSFTINATPPNQSKTITYGGIAVAKAPTSLSPMLGAQKFDQSFTFGQNVGQLAPDSKFKITVDGTTYTFTATASSPSTNKLEFNSIKTLSDTINAQTKLKSRIDSAGNLYIAPVNADHSVTFTNSDGTAIKEALGIIDIPASGGEGIRFNSLNTLQQAINFNQENFGFKATISEGALDMTALLATSGFEISATSYGVRPIGFASFGNNTVKGQATATIVAPKNFLTAGDYVKLQGLGSAHIPDGTYYVSAADTNTFSVNLMSENPNVIADGTINNGYPAVAAATSLVVNTATSSWQKVGGFAYESKQSTALAAAVAADGVLTLTCAGHDLADNDVIYLSSVGRFSNNARNINLPDGYYIVSNVAGNDFDIKPSLDTAGALDLTNYPASNGGDVAFKKIGSTTVAGNFSGVPQIDNNLMVTTGGAGSNLVKLYMPSHEYTVGDTISFSGLPVALTLDGIALENNIQYKITAITASSVTFEVFQADGLTPAVSVTGDEVVGLQKYSDLTDFQVNNYSRMFEYFGIDQSTSIYNPKYDSTNVAKSLASGVFDREDAGTFTHPVTVYDSLGAEFSILIKAAKLDNNKWAVEIVASEDESNGQFLGIGSDRLLRAGTINFDVDGGFISNINLDTPILINRNNGSDTTSIVIDWANTLSVGSKGTITQFGSPNSVEFVKQNGQSAGTLESIEINQEGDVVAQFNNGSSKKVFRIPVVTMINPNGLADVFGDAQKTTLNSGPLNAKFSGSDGAGQIISGALEKSNIDTTAELLDLSDIMQHLKLVSRSEAKEQEMKKTILDEIG